MFNVLFYISYFKSSSADVDKNIIIIHHATFSIVMMTVMKTLVIQMTINNFINKMFANKIC